MGPMRVIVPVSTQYHLKANRHSPKLRRQGGKYPVAMGTLLGTLSPRDKWVKFLLFILAGCLGLGLLKHSNAIYPSKKDWSHTGLRARKERRGARRNGGQ